MRKALLAYAELLLGMLQVNMASTFGNFSYTRNLIEQIIGRHILYSLMVKVCIPIEGVAEEFSDFMILE